MKPPAFAIHSTATREFYAILTNRKGQIIMKSPTYKTKGECYDAIDQTLISALRARTFDDGAHEAASFGWLIAMDKQNQRDMIARGAPRESVHLMLSFHADPPCDEVPDPYYGGDDGFDRVYDMLVGACEGLLEQIEGAGRIKP